MDNGTIITRLLLTVLLIWLCVSTLSFNGMVDLVPVGYQLGSILTFGQANGTAEVAHETGEHGAGIASTNNTSNGTELVLPDKEADKKRNKLILLWSYYNPEHNRWDEMRDFGQEPFARDKCKNQNCYLTLDRGKVGVADYVMFFDADLGPGWPQERPPRQSYIHIACERPGPWHNWMKAYDDKINLTMNYRRNADIYYYNFGYQKREVRIPGEYKVKYPLSSKTKGAAWIVSHCKAESKRDDYVKELSKYISVDIFGRCGNLTCPHTHACADKIERNYKFYLAFENAMCDGYVTEKTFGNLRLEVVPVALGKVDYKLETPPHSVIDVRDYPSPKALAEYLNYLSSNETAYYEYFQWKQEYLPHRSMSEYCALCDGIHDPKLANGKAAGGYYNWWFGGCDNDYVSRMRDEGGW